MKKTLFYVVEKQLQGNSDCEETTGWKTITVYEIIKNQPKIFCEIEAKIEDSSENEIQTYLDNNGLEDQEFDFQQL
jgi:hypothetical protein